MTPTSFHANSTNFIATTKLFHAGEGYFSRFFVIKEKKVIHFCNSKMAPIPTSSLAGFTPLPDERYIDGLKSGDPVVTHSFFYDLCRYTLTDIINSLMGRTLDYDDLVNELYVYLSTDNWRKLDTFRALNGCRLSSWVSVVAWRFFMRSRPRLLHQATADLAEVERQPPTADIDIEIEISIDVENTFAAMPNKRYANLLRLLLIEGYDSAEAAKRLETTVDNIYNLKRRAIQQFIATYRGSTK